MSEEKEIVGGCLCGAICFKITSPKWCANCYCAMCRKVHGAPFVTWVGVAQSDLLIFKGKEHLKQYQSSPAAQRGSCDICGSQMFFQSKRWPDEIHITRASLPDDMNLQAQAHYFFDDRAPWIQVDDSLPRYGGTTGTETQIIS